MNRSRPLLPQKTLSRGERLWEFGGRVGVRAELVVGLATQFATQLRGLLDLLMRWAAFDEPAAAGRFELAHLRDEDGQVYSDATFGGVEGSHDGVNLEATDTLYPALADDGDGGGRWWRGRGRRP